MKAGRYISFLFLFLACMAARSQDFHFSGFIPNRTFMNPAAAVMPVSPEFTVTYRNQWPGIPATFVTYGAAFILPVESMKSGLGVNVLNDVQGDGVITRTYVGLSYGYRIDLQRDWQVGAGISASYVFRKLDADELVFRSEILNELGYGYSAVTLENQTRSYPDFAIGMVVQNGYGFSAGISVSHITRPEESLSSQFNSRIPLKYAGFIKTRFGSSSRYSGLSVTFEPSAFYSRQAKNEELIWGMQAVFSSVFAAGAWFRQNLRFNYDAVIFSVGILMEKYNFFYSYDVNLKKLNFLSTKMGAHEVTFLYRMEYKGRKARAVECPAYAMLFK
ncbi:MAG: PorP/SprF family type IX secretion system membrane protein [Bacteroidales bacterium]|nr:PorP/SprF family type IX secretion system membrane protein [Bacteroidales bacterium]